MSKWLGKTSVLGLFLVIGVLFAACGAPAGNRPAAPAEAAPAAPAAAVPTPVVPAPVTPPPVELSAAAPSPAPSQFPMEITDQLGRVVKLKKAPQRIISLAPSNTEILYALGLGDRVVGRTDYCDYPADAKTKPSVGGYSSASAEKVVALNPDLVVATSIHQAKVIPVLESLGYPVVALAPNTVDGVLDSITLIGKVTDTQAEATAVVTGLRNRIKAVTDKTANLPSDKKPRVFYVVWYDPLMSSGNGTFQADLIEKAGGINVARDLVGWKAISLEAVITANPEVMIAGDMSAGGANFQFVSTEPRLANTIARKGNFVFTVNSDVASRPGPRIVDALEEFARYIHPELFK